MPIMDPKRLVILVFCALVLTSSSVRGCDENQFTCANLNCIPVGWVCDTDNDCGDNSDESHCLAPCGADQFTCGDGSCIPSHYECDQFSDCQDGSDEDHCSSIWPPTVPQGCSFNEFICASGICIPNDWVCDNFDDCRDGSDEEDCFHNALAIIIGVSIAGAAVTTIIPVCICCVICCCLSSCPLYALCHKQTAVPGQPVMTTVVGPSIGTGTGTPSYPMQQMPQLTYPPPGYGYPPPPSPFFTAGSGVQGATVYPTAAAPAVTEENTV